MNRRPVKKNKQKSKSPLKLWLKRIGMAIIIFVFIFPFATCNAISLYLNFQEREMNVLIVGTDNTEEREEERDNTSAANGNADFIKVMSVDTFPNDVTLYTIPRDTPIEIADSEACDQYPAAGPWKASYIMRDTDINCMMDSVGAFLGLEIDKYIAFDINNAINFIDDIGGITLTATATFCEQDSHATPNAYCFEKGETYDMDGEMAVAYGRNRHATDSAVGEKDYARGYRQIEVMKATAQQLIYLVLHGNSNVVEAAIMDNLYSNMEFSDIVILGATTLIDLIEYWNGAIEIQEVKEPLA